MSSTIARLRSTAPHTVTGCGAKSEGGHHRSRSRGGIYNCGKESNVVEGHLCRRSKSYWMGNGRIWEATNCSFGWRDSGIVVGVIGPSLSPSTTPRRTITCRRRPSPASSVAAVTSRIPSGGGDAAARRAGRLGMRYQPQLDDPALTALYRAGSLALGRRAVLVVAPVPGPAALFCGSSPTTRCAAASLRGRWESLRLIGERVLTEIRWAGGRARSLGL